MGHAVWKSVLETLQNYRKKRNAWKPNSMTRPTDKIGLRKVKWLCTVLVLWSRTDFFVDMSGQISSQRQQLSTKQWSGNKCSDVPTKLRDGSSGLAGKQWRAERQACRCTCLTARFSQTVKPFCRFILSIFCFLNVSFLFQNSTLLCQQKRIFVDMSYFLKIAVLSPILSTKRLLTTALLCTGVFP